MILISGATGLLGAHLLYELLKQNNQVTAIRRSTKNMAELQKTFAFYTDQPDEFLSKVNWITADMLNYQDMLEVTTGIDEIYHCAAIVSFDPACRASMIEENTKGTANIVNAAIENNARKLIHVSSTAAIGRAPEGQLADESMVWSESKSNTGYSISKFHSEMEVWRGIQEGLNAAIVNPSIILGPGFWQHGSSSIIDKVYHGLKFYSHGVTGYVSVWDVVAAMTQLMESEISGERYLVTSENLTYKEVFDMIADEFKKPRPSIEGTKFMSELAWRADYFKSKILRIGEHTFTSERVRAARNKVSFSNEKITKELNFTFQPIKDTVHQVCKYYSESIK